MSGGDGTQRARATTWALAAGLALAAVLIAPAVLFQIDRLLFATDDKAAVDLGFRVAETAAWWRGDPAYQELSNAVYPPHAYLLLRWLLVEPAFPAARMAWAAQMVGLLALCGWAFARFGGQVRERAWLAASVPLLLGATWQGVGNGQLHLLPLVCGCAAVVVGSRGGVSLGRDLAAAGLMVVALMKPTSGLAFLGLLLVLPGRLRPALLALGLLAGSTLAAASLQPEGVVELAGQFVQVAMDGAEHGSIHGGTSNSMTWLAFADAPRLGAVATLGMLGGLVAWAGARARADLLTMLGVAGLVARLSVYHRPYDDVLALPALLALLVAGRRDRWALALFFVTLVVMAVPGPPVTSEAWIGGWRSGFGWLWAVDLAALVWLVERDQRRS